MIVGDTSKMALESQITCAYEERGFVALGFFIIHVGGREYGVREPDAAMLANSLESAKERILMRGAHTVFFAQAAPAKEVAMAFIDAIYGPEPEARRYFGASHSVFSSAVQDGGIVWAPDGDAAFDDGSHVLQFDIEEKVRLIAFRQGDSPEVESLSDIHLGADDYYETLRRWVEAFESEWSLAPKSASNTSH